MPPSLQYEQALKRKGYTVIAGVDEAGRGPLAGPVVAAAVILPSRYTLKGIDDSKKLSPEKRQQLYGALTSSVDYGVGIIEETIIDDRNILQATFLAMNKAIAALKGIPEHILFDGNRYNRLQNIPQTLIIKGDSISRSIAAASIIAKVTRDHIMEQYHAQYPQYGFDRHKGYGTQVHRDALQKYGPCPIHRKTFITSILSLA